MMASRNFPSVLAPFFSCTAFPLRQAVCTWYTPEDFGLYSTRFKNSENLYALLPSAPAKITGSALMTSDWVKGPVQTNHRGQEDVLLQNAKPGSRAIFRAEESQSAHTAQLN